MRALLLISLLSIFVLACTPVAPTSTPRPTSTPTPSAEMLALLADEALIEETKQLLARIELLYFEVCPQSFVSATLSHWQAANASAAGVDYAIVYGNLTYEQIMESYRELRESLIENKNTLEGLCL